MQIDGSVLEQNGGRYFVWSGWTGNEPEHGQSLFIARMADPWTVTGPRHLLSSPTQPWERIGREPINEGPALAMLPYWASMYTDWPATWLPMSLGKSA